MPKAKLGLCKVLAIDPGTTTGLVVVSVRPGWLKGQGPASWEGMADAIEWRNAYHTGRHPRWLGDADAASPTDTVDDVVMPILAEHQPLLDMASEFGGRGRKDESFYAILGGEQSKTVGRAELLVTDAEEILQVRQIIGLASNLPTATIVCEDFILRTQNRSRETLSPDRLRLAIQVEEVLHGEGRIPFLQQPSQAKSTATDDRLKRAHLYFTGMPHATDAARHVALFLRRCRQSAELRAQAFPRHFADWDDGDDDMDNNDK
ncbi:MAG: hypothetical protein ACRDQA_02380 [Nocardioidaceae bacterium]